MLKVATHICDSIKRRLKGEGVGNGLQGEFGIGLLSFWTVGSQLTMISAGSDQRSYQMTMSKGDSGCTVSPRRVLFAERGTELRISPLLEGIRDTLRREDPVNGLGTARSNPKREGSRDRSSISLRASSTRLSRAHTKVGCCINYRRSAQRLAMPTQNSISRSPPTAVG